MTALLTEAALRSLLLGLAVWLALRLFRVRSSQAEMTVWSTVLAAALAMPLLMQWPLLQLATAPNPIANAVHALDPVGFTRSLAPAMPTSPAFVASYGATALAGLYCIVAAMLLIRLLTGLIRTWRIAHAALPVRAGWVRGADVRVTDAVKSPVTFGRIILLPFAYVSWPLAKREAVLRHERSHIERRDFVVQLLCGLHSALFWFSPFAWWLQYRLAFLAELASDEAAVAWVGNRIDYAEILLDIAVNARGLPAGIAMARPAMLQQRVERILSQAKAAAVLSPRGRLLLALSLLPSIFLAGGTTWQVSAADIALGSHGLPAAHRGASAFGSGFVVVSGGKILTPFDKSAAPASLITHAQGMDNAVLFRHQGKIFEITDPDLVGRAVALVGAGNDLEARRQALEEKQSELGEQQGELGKQQGELGRQMGVLAERHALAATKVALREADGGADSDGEYHQALDELKQQMKALGREQGRLGQEQGRLGAEQGRLGREQSRLVQDLDGGMQRLIEQALDSGAARPAP